MIFFGADHGGYELKERIKGHLDELGVPYEDIGAYSEEPVDYPDYALRERRRAA
ncbi:MAG: RpiB/LacA/LacB family sugar-phosphate isomerase [Chloroflexi bacterium]|nr:RpiB/LacA/LacB family sugar-phosphate isomerase [Chloroflexota bacterium]